MSTTPLQTNSCANTSLFIFLSNPGTRLVVTIEQKESMCTVDYYSGYFEVDPQQVQLLKGQTSPLKPWNTQLSSDQQCPPPKSTSMEMDES